MVNVKQSISPKKRARIGRTVIPHLKRSDYFLASGKPIKAETEVNKAIGALRKERAMPPDLMQIIADKLHSIGVMILDDGEFENAVSLFTKSLRYKIEFSTKGESILSTKHGLTVACIFSCHFDLAKNLIEELREEALKTGNTDLLKAAEEYHHQLTSIMKNEPLIAISEARLNITGQEKKYPIGTDIYLPRLFNDLEAIIDRVELTTSHDRILCSIDFQICEKGNPITLKPYEEDSWKNSSSPLWRTIPEGTDNFFVFIEDGMVINENEVKIQADNEILLRLNMRVGDVFIPDSYPMGGVSFPKNRKHHPATDLIPTCKNFMFFRGRWCAFRWKLRVNEKYRIEFPVHISNPNVKFAENELSFRIGFFFPFKFFKLSKVNVASRSDLRLLTARNSLVSYMRTRGPVGAWCFYFDGKNAVPSPPKPWSLEQEPMKNYELINSNSIVEDYCLLKFQFSYQLPEKVLVSVKTWNDVIPTGIYHSSSSSHEYRIPLAEYHIINNTTSAQRMELRTQILGFTEEERDFCTVPKKSALNIYHSPKMLPESLTTIGPNTNCQIRTIASALSRGDQNESQLLDETYQTILSPHNIMVWQVINPLTGIIENLACYLAGWVTPRAKEITKLVDDIMAEGKEKLLGYNSKTTSENEQRESVLKEIKAIFDALQLKYQLKYSNEVIYYGTDKAYFFQSIKLPNDTLQTRSGNCIDFSVLFASVLEAVGINSAIVLIPGHAFVGWETWNESAKFQFLETTAIEKLSFEDAFSIGQEHMSKGTHVSTPIPYEFPDSPILIQIKKLREKGIMPIIDS